MVFLFVMPMWMNFLLHLRLDDPFGKKGPAQHLPFVGGIGTLNLLYTEEAVVLGMVYNFLPFMVLPIYSVLSKIDKSLIEAAEDLGADGLRFSVKLFSR